MPRSGIENPPFFGSNLPMPSDMETNLEKKEICLKYYKFWIRILDEGINGEALVNAGNNFFEEELKELNGAAEWLEEEDPALKKTRAVLIKEKAFQDWYRVHRGKRGKPPSVYFSR